jgi:hypothetical protein
MTVPGPGDSAEPDYEVLAERAYDEMYESPSPAGPYNDLKYYFARAIGVAERAGRSEDAARLTKRLEHCIAVYRSQFWISGGGFRAHPEPASRFAALRYLRSQPRLVRASRALFPALPALTVACFSCASMALLVEAGAGKVLLGMAAMLVAAVIALIVLLGK